MCKRKLENHKALSFSLPDVVEGRRKSVSLVNRRLEEGVQCYQQIGVESRQILGVVYKILQEMLLEREPEITKIGMRRSA